jgi:hypothetical protein
MIYYRRVADAPLNSDLRFRRRGAVLAKSCQPGTCGKLFAGWRSLVVPVEIVFVVSATSARC